VNPYLYISLAQAQGFPDLTVWQTGDNKSQDFPVFTREFAEGLGNNPEFFTDDTVSLNVLGRLWCIVLDKCVVVFMALIIHQGIAGNCKKKCRGSLRAVPGKLIMPGEAFLHDIPGDFIITTSEHQVAEQFVLVPFIKLSVFFYHCDKKVICEPGRENINMFNPFLLFFLPGVEFFYAVWADAMAYNNVEVMDQKTFQVNPVALVVFYLFTP
jgi:hypothetical protein